MELFDSWVEGHVGHGEVAGAVDDEVKLLGRVRHVGVEVLHDDGELVLDRVVDHVAHSVAELDVAPQVELLPSS